MQSTLSVSDLLREIGNALRFVIRNLISQSAMASVSLGEDLAYYWPTDRGIGLISPEVPPCCAICSLQTAQEGLAAAQLGRGGMSELPLLLTALARLGISKVKCGVDGHLSFGRCGRGRRTILVDDVESN